MRKSASVCDTMGINKCFLIGTVKNARRFHAVPSITLKQLELQSAITRNAFRHCTIL